MTVSRKIKMAMNWFLASQLFSHVTGAAFVGTLSQSRGKESSTLLCVASKDAPTVDKTRRTAPSEVVKMFNDFSDHFESKLVDVLEYSAPKDIAATASRRIDEAREGRLYESVLDAGCGTGLAGPHIYPLLEGPLIGVDLSPKMAEMAAELLVDDGDSPIAPDRMRRSGENARNALGGTDRLYDGVYIGDLLDLANAKQMEGYGHVIRRFQKDYELVISADVMCYFGEMGAVLEVFADMLSPGGDLIFSTETIAEGDYNWIRCESERYAHNPEYIAKQAAGAGLSMVSQEAFTPRIESGEKVLGTLHTFHKPS